MAMGTSVFRIRTAVDLPPVLKSDHTMRSCRAASLRAGRPGQDTLKCPNAPKLNNAWWRWFGSGPRNPPVIIRLHGSAKVHRLGTIAGQRSRESELGDGAMTVIGPSGAPNQTRTGGRPRLGEGPSDTWRRLRSAP
jgi:hypothetical protein